MRTSKQSACLVCVFSMLLFIFGAVAAQGQEYTSIVVFGDSLSDTGNVGDLTYAKYGVRVPGPAADYTNGRFTDGADTIPAARAYYGVWIEQLASMLPGRPVIKNSLEKGTDYAYGFATTGGGTSAFTFGQSNSLSVNINNMGQQITDYLATHPKIDNKTLFVVWGGAIDVLYATSEKDVVNAAIKEAADIQRLIDAGATQFLVPNLPPLGAVPRLNGSPATSVPATQESVVYNTTLSVGLDVLPLLNFGRRLHIYRLDVFSLFNKIIAAPAKYDLANVTGSSQGLYTVNPDTYLFWDSLHPTTYGHDILALSALKLVAPLQCETFSQHGEKPSCASL